MKSGGQTDRGPRHYFQVLARRKYVFLLALVLVPGTALVQSLRQKEIHEASSRVISSSRPVSSPLVGTYSPTVAERVLAKVPIPGETVQDLLRATKVSTEATTAAEPSARGTGASPDVITFTVRQHEPARARRLANEYARQYMLYRRGRDAAQLKSAIATVERQIADAQARPGDKPSRLLTTRQEQLRALQALQASPAPVVEPATSVAKVEPRLARNLLLAVALGTLLGLGLALLWEALAYRFASAAEVAAAIGMPLLASLPSPSSGRSGADGLAAPGSSEAEAFRSLRGTVDVFIEKLDARTIMVAGARPDEGSTSVSVNLAAALAQAGRMTTLVDLDLRRSGLTRLLGLERRPGVTDVAQGSIALDDATATLEVSDGHGMLRVLAAGASPPDPGTFLMTPDLSSVLDALRAESDVLVVDAPPLLEVADALAVGTEVDAVLLVMRGATARRPTIDALRRVMAECPADGLGLVLIGGKEHAERDTGQRTRGLRTAPVTR